MNISMTALNTDYYGRGDITLTLGDDGPPVVFTASDKRLPVAIRDMVRALTSGDSGYWECGYINFIDTLSGDDARRAWVNADDEVDTPEHEEQLDADMAAAEKAYLLEEGLNLYAECLEDSDWAWLTACLTAGDILSAAELLYEELKTTLGDISDTPYYPGAEFSGLLYMQERAGPTGVIARGANGKIREFDTQEEFLVYAEGAEFITVTLGAAGMSWYGDCPHDDDDIELGVFIRGYLCDGDIGEPIDDGRRVTTAADAVAAVAAYKLSLTRLSA